MSNQYVPGGHKEDEKQKTNDRKMKAIERDYSDEQVDSGIAIWCWFRISLLLTRHLKFYCIRSCGQKNNRFGINLKRNSKEDILMLVCVYTFSFSVYRIIF